MEKPQKSTVILDKPVSESNLTDKDFYDQACSYFYYHAGQRMNMINYFIAVFGASLALYGSLLAIYTLASMMIAIFLIIVSLLFYSIDLRNRFDVKQSQIVIAQFEKKYGMNLFKEEHAFGVFSNEENVFKLFGFNARRKIRKNRKEEYNELKRLKKDHSIELKKTAEKYLENDNFVSPEVLIDSLNKRPILTLSFCIKLLYIICTMISVVGAVFAVLITSGVIVL